MSVRLMMASLSIILAATVELGCSQVYKYHSCCGWGNLVNKLIKSKRRWSDFIWLLHWKDQQ